MIPPMRSLSLLVLAAGVVALAACTEFAMRDGADESDAEPMPMVEQAAPEFGFFQDQSRAKEEAAMRPQPMPAAAALPPPPMAPAPAAPSAAPHPPSEIGDGATITEEAAAALVTQRRIIVRTVEMHLIVSDVSGMVKEASDLAAELEGWVVSWSDRQKHRGHIAIRVPAERLNDALLRLRGLAVEVESEDSTSRDVTDEYVDITARLGNLEATEEALLKLMERAETVEEALKVQNTLTEIQGEIESLQGRIKFLEQTSAYSLINITLELKPAEMSVDAGADQTAGVGEAVRFRAFFKPPDDIEDFFFTWDFGDGTPPITSDRTAPTEDQDTRVAATVTHQYFDDVDSPFFAEVKITGTGDAGLAEGEAIVIVTVTKIPVIQVFAGERVTVEEDEEIEFDGSFTRPEGVTSASFEWDFGDGSTPETGELETGLTRAVAKHVYADHRPFAYTATLTITGQSDAGEVDSSSSVSVRVTEAPGWVVAGWTPGESGKTAVRNLSGVARWLVSAFIWVVIFSPVWVVLLGAVVLGKRRIRFRRKRA